LQDGEGNKEEMNETNSVLNKSNQIIEDQSKGVTVPVPFNLTKLKPKMIPLP
jgi:hypothetical protein